MKIWELCNIIKKTNASRNTIRDWSIMNRICPASFQFELPAKGANGKVIAKAASNVCESYSCGMDCLDAFLDTEV